ncbi:MAG: sialate O-acetylesterase [Tidjanibacter sp.]|nr:sialate O-acetylesterase [Tidjanibacter sp.]
MFVFSACNETGQQGEGGEPEPEDVVYDVYLFIGQSNMAGRGAMIAGDDEPIPNVYLLGTEDTPVPAVAPPNFYSTVRKGMKLQGINPAWQFAKEMSEKSKNPVLIVCNARGATSLSMWQKNAGMRFYSEAEGDDKWLWNTPMPSLYGEAVRRCKEAMKYGQLKAICWHQGCGDSQEGVVKTYLNRLNTFVTDLRTDLGVGSEVPFIAGELYYGYTNAFRFNPEIRKIGDVITEGYWVSAEGCTSNADQVHFSRQGQILLGERYADKVFELLDVEKEEAAQ